VRNYFPPSLYPSIIQQPATSTDSFSPSNRRICLFSRH
jgi:hypothetical protein